MMIWRTEHIVQETNFYTYVQARERENQSLHYSNTVAIVGGGPKGLYALNHFINQLKLYPTSKYFKILWFNQDKLFGCGPNYDIHQPDYLLINYCIGHVQAFHPDYRDYENQKSFVDWLTAVKTIDTPVAPTDFASRALVGRYLQWVATETTRNLPTNVQLELISQPVTTITYQDIKVMVETQTGAWEVDSLLLATGHCYQNSPLVHHPEIPAAHYIRAAYPVSQFAAIPPQEHVGVVGLGLTFIDIALALTEGRGGVFSHGQYKPTGKEPVIYPFSRTSLPICCRGPQYHAQRPLFLMTDAWFRTLMDRSAKIDFLTEVLPSIEKEVQLAYYSVLIGSTDLQAILKKIKCVPKEERFTLKDLLQPSLGSEEEIVSYIQMNIEEAHKGEDKSPRMAAAAVWGKICPWIADLYRTVGYTGASQQQLDSYYFGAFNRVSYGPPIANMEKIYALAKAGIIRFCAFQNPKVRWQTRQQTFLIQDPSGLEIQVATLIDARIGRPALQKKNAFFYDNLLQQGLIKQHENEGYSPGTLSMDKHGKCTTINNVPVYCYGSNTEGVFFDNDTLSRTKNNTACYWVEETLKDR
ncbi:FAD/NAD(P)-binding protein [Sphingobacterium arenae]|uniref:FAD/NAD(P)-binding protein n=1 Tax=Sphingobacterium arenae TaxID=1280598 RepID=A0ABR7Y6S4_9SPHI|nr:FAD/NAD(P)-binding protein [Sphingobacterium arenae]MBD1426958.1 FAD/NAD(P)-binding protein [Sphingobacterium arenae]